MLEFYIMLIYFSGIFFGGEGVGLPPVALSPTPVAEPQPPPHQLNQAMEEREVREYAQLIPTPQL